MGFCLLIILIRLDNFLLISYNDSGDNMKICVLGAGAYGSALSIILNENGNDVTMWTRFEQEATEMNSNHKCSKLPEVTLPNNIKVSSSLNEATKDAAFVVIAIPTAFVSGVLKEAKEFIKDKPIVIASKGIEQDSCLFVSDMVDDILETDNIAVLSGPSFAIDVANKVPVGITLACQHKETIELVTKAFCNGHFKLRVCSDIIGTEICGAIKNVIAIAAGILDGMGMPESTSAMFINESIHDIKSLIKGLGGDGSTILSFAGFGDLLLTATSPKSRNYSFGHLIGSGASKSEIDEYIANTTIEGLYTLKSIHQLIENRNVEMPIIDLIQEIIYGDKKPNDLVSFLIEKP
ncbi:MAG: NAD(P)-dependent glycerol-3-phosphate dehydrogenase [Clostridia bacterium]|nr:NAD(P)-dependent glycerol-3-phosphate dehydrogenase [Clostridia bacterium]